ncbi:Tryptase alpha/beta-1 [Trichinella spiralis]|uniref:Tryptase alpha/beta-1 n=1 Tax=Trichinella spiralis TaxID=6334 RepID=A0ABR3KAP6_TRISP
MHMRFFIYFVFLSSVLQPTFSADCGIHATTKSLYVHLVVIAAERNPDEKQCLGTIVHLQHNDTYSDTILTSKSCLKSKDLKSTVVVTALDFYKTDILKSIRVVRSIFPKTLGHLASKIHPSVSSPASINRNYALLKLKKPIVYDNEKHSVCLPQESEITFPISRKCYLPKVYKNGRLGNPMKVAVHSKYMVANYSSETYREMDLIVETKSIFNSRKRIHEDEFIVMGMPILCIDAEKYFKVHKYFQYGIFDQQRTILQRDSSKLIYVFTSLFNAINHIMFVVSTKEFHHGYPGVETETP